MVSSTSAFLAALAFAPCAVWAGVADSFTLEVNTGCTNTYRPGILLARYNNTQVTSPHDCAQNCLNTAGCVTFQYSPIGGHRGRRCEEEEPGPWCNENCYLLSASCFKVNGYDTWDNYEKPSRRLRGPEAVWN
eukprot:TRINITY_DN31848_c0_g1_i1.p1 TRINITY_DN31848_c0_g1~~TRINITY_DN31848_c0_g1_i1.p1  ORF type:complete len:133 (+),score=9.55 TRINITY_DN31848_c0_g1_i1:101-499(+)